MTTLENQCVLGHGICKVSGQAAHCNNICTPFIQLHGASGKGGKIGLGNTPRAYRLMTLKNSPVRQLQPENYAIIDRYISRLFNTRDLKDEQLSLYLYSENPGTGKSTTASAILNTYIVKDFLRSIKEEASQLQRPAYFLDTNEWQTTYNNATRHNVPASVAEEAWEKYYSMMNIAKKVPFLVLDDVAVRSITEGHRGDLHALINERVGECLPTVYTSNIPLSALPDVFNEPRLYDRMRDMTLELHFEGESQRGIRK